MVGGVAMPPAFGHGNLKPSQFLFDGPLCGLVDFDSNGFAEPAVDLGRFQGHLAMTTGKAQGTTRKAQGTTRKAQGTAASGADLIPVLDRTFLNQYLLAAGIEDPDWLRRRVAAERILTRAHDRTARRSVRRLLTSLA